MKPYKILIVDDDVSFLKYLQCMLEKEFETIHTLADGRMAAETILHGNYDMVLIDERLIGMSGSDIARAVLERNPAQRIVIVTGYTQDAKPPAGVPVVDKPVTPDRILASIRDVMGNYARPNRTNGLGKALGALAGFCVRIVGACGAAFGSAR